jgi:NADH-ubiquinone oxidoreductase chain 2
LLYSSLLSLTIGSIVGLSQLRIKRLYAFSTISHVGFILLALSIHTVESTQAFLFYLFQYSISNLNAFIIIIAIGYSLYSYTYTENPVEKNDSKNDNSIKISDKNHNLQDINNSPIQLIDQLKGYYYINP